MTEIKNQYLQKISCNNKNKKCHNLVPYYKYDFINNSNTTTKEKESNLLKYRNACSNRGGKLNNCCDKNDKNKKAWALIKDSGCDKFSEGDAKISEKHSNFFINAGNATASDVENLILKVRKEVKIKTGVNLELEIKIIGNED